jgi:hypothetical protein
MGFFRAEYTTVASWSSNEQPKAHSFSRSPLSRCSINPAEQCALTLSYSSLSYYSLQLDSQRRI